MQNAISQGGIVKSRYCKKPARHQAVQAGDESGPYHSFDFLNDALLDRMYRLNMEGKKRLTYRNPATHQFWFWRGVSLFLFLLSKG